MDEFVKVRESKILLAAGILGTVFSVPCLILSISDGIRHQDMETLMICIPVFGVILLLGLLLLLIFFRRKLILYSDRFSYTPTLGRTKTFFYSEIQSVAPKGEKYVLYGYDGARLAVFEVNMQACAEALNFLLEKQVKIAPGPPLPLSSLTRKISDWSLNLHLTDKDTYIRSRYLPASIHKRKRIARIIRIMLVILCVLAILLPNKWMMTAYILILLFNYFQFLFFYPQMILEKAKDCGENFIPFPILSCAVSMLFLITFIDMYNMEEGKWVSMSAALLVILLIPYLLIRRIRRIKEHPFKIMFAAFVLFILSFVLVPPINYVTAGRPTHSTVTVLSKETYRNKVTHYEIFVFWRNEVQKMEVSRDLYETLDTGDPVRVCVRKGILGAEIWNVHE